jgi:hypothetical protein
MGGPAALGQLVNAAVVQVGIYTAALDLVVKVAQVLHKALVHHEPQDLAAAAIQVFLCFMCGTLRLVSLSLIVLSSQYMVCRLHSFYPQVAMLTSSSLRFFLRLLWLVRRRFVRVQWLARGGQQYWQQNWQRQRRSSGSVGSCHGIWKHYRGLGV